MTPRLHPLSDAAVTDDVVAPTVFLIDVGIDSVIVIEQTIVSPEAANVTVPELTIAPPGEAANPVLATALVTKPTTAASAKALSSSDRFKLFISVLL